MIAQNKQRSTIYLKQIEVYQKQLQAIKAKGEDQLTPADQARIKAYERVIESYQKYVDREGDRETPQSQIDQQVAAMTSRKMKMSSISATKDHVFLACAALEGYGYDVWRMNQEFGDAEKIVTDLRGCCGQMDVQANSNGLFVAENSRHRVCCYNAKGDLITTWGERARSGLTGFGSCCNPMNVAFGPGAEVYTAESTSGRIKRYNPQGEMLGLVGQVDLVPGCKNVSIAVSNTGDRVYMLDITRTHIVMMTRKNPSEKAQAAQ